MAVVNYACTRSWGSRFSEGGMTLADLREFVAKTADAHGDAQIQFQVWRDTSTYSPVFIEAVLEEGQEIKAPVEGVRG